MMSNEEMDYKLSRLQPGGSCKRMFDSWAYLDSKGTLHKLTNDGYYFGFGTNMWSSTYWKNNGTWAMGNISTSKKGLIQAIENDVKKCNFPEWVSGFGKIPAIEEALL